MLQRRSTSQVTRRPPTRAASHGRGTGTRRLSVGTNRHGQVPRGAGPLRPGSAAVQATRKSQKPNNGRLPPGARVHVTETTFRDTEGLSDLHNEWQHADRETKREMAMQMGKQLYKQRGLWGTAKMLLTGNKRAAAEELRKFAKKRQQQPQSSRTHA